MSQGGVELWTTEDVRVFLRLATRNAADKAMRRYEVDAHSREPGRSGQNLYDAEAVKREHAKRTGKGRRTDLQ